MNIINQPNLASGQQYAVKSNRGIDFRDSTPFGANIATTANGAFSPLKNYDYANGNNFFSTNNLNADSLDPSNMSSNVGRSEFANNNINMAEASRQYENQSNLNIGDTTGINSPINGSPALQYIQQPSQQDSKLTHQNGGLIIEKANIINGYNVSGNLEANNTESKKQGNSVSLTSSNPYSSPYNSFNSNTMLQNNGNNNGYYTRSNSIFEYNRSSSITESLTAPPGQQSFNLGNSDMYPCSPARSGATVMNDEILDDTNYNYKPSFDVSGNNGGRSASFSRPLSNADTTNPNTGSFAMSNTISSMMPHTAIGTTFGIIDEEYGTSALSRHSQKGMGSYSQRDFDSGNFNGTSFGGASRFDRFGSFSSSTGTGSFGRSLSFSVANSMANKDQGNTQERTNGILNDDGLMTNRRNLNKDNDAEQMVANMTNDAKNFNHGPPGLNLSYSSFNRKSQTQQDMAFGAPHSQNASFDGSISGSNGRSLTSQGVSFTADRSLSLSNYGLPKPQYVEYINPNNSYPVKENQGMLYPNNYNERRQFSLSSNSAGNAISAPQFGPGDTITGGSFGSNNGPVDMGISQSVLSDMGDNNDINNMKMMRMKNNNYISKSLPQSQNITPQLQKLSRRNLPSTTTSSLGLENGLLLVNNHIITSPELRALYRSSDGYFCIAKAEKVYNGIKSLLDPMAPYAPRVSQLVGFLKRKNDIGGYGHGNGHHNGNSSGNTANFVGIGDSLPHKFKNMCLVCSKAGKIDVLTVSPNSNILLQKHDLVIVEGDRGKDLVHVIEPTIGLNFVVVLNFLKKREHLKSMGGTSSSGQGRGDSFGSGKSSSGNYNQDDEHVLTLPVKQILRFASANEVGQLPSKLKNEIVAFKIAIEKLNQINMKANVMNRKASVSSQSSFDTRSYGVGKLGSPNVSGSISTNSSAGNDSKPQLDLKIFNSEYQFDKKKLIFYYSCAKRNDFRDLIKELFKIYKTRIWLCAVLNPDEFNSYNEGNISSRRNLEIEMAEYAHENQLQSTSNNENILEFSSNSSLECMNPSLTAKNLSEVEDGVNSFSGSNIIPPSSPSPNEGLSSSVNSPVSSGAELVTSPRTAASTSATSGVNDSGAVHSTVATSISSGSILEDRKNSAVSQLSLSDTIGMLNLTGTSGSVGASGYRKCSVSSIPSWTGAVVTNGAPVIGNHLVCDSNSDVISRNELGLGSPKGISSNHIGPDDTNSNEKHAQTVKYAGTSPSTFKPISDANSTKQVNMVLNLARDQQISNKYQARMNKILSLDENNFKMEEVEVDDFHAQNLLNSIENLKIDLNIH
ncbi:Psp1 protein [Saccharomycopsis crataegensis]|uniref:Psp1 protein n=1 Tax=Saccharomycopsis crataegensis TaxID=43959 RepID=A0AAV5QI70_9ASCO|nr:Psp1 protein [Saccharomycopsis crataegensis]